MLGCVILLSVLIFVVWTLPTLLSCSSSLGYQMDYQGIAVLAFRSPLVYLIMAARVGILVVWICQREVEKCI